MSKVINEDGTGVNMPKNPLKEKWKEEYPMMSNCSKPNMDGNSYNACATCSDCPKGFYFKVSKEDLAIYRKYLEDCVNYLREHNPNMEISKKYTKKYVKIK